MEPQVNTLVEDTSREYLKKECTFKLRKADLTDDTCDLFLDCEQEIPWNKYHGEVYMRISLPADHIHKVYRDIKSGARVRVIIEPISDDEHSMGEKDKP